MNYSKTTKRENSAKLLAATTFNQNFVFESETVGDGQGKGSESRLKNKST